MEAIKIFLQIISGSGSGDGSGDGDGSGYGDGYCSGSGDGYGSGSGSGDGYGSGYGYGYGSGSGDGLKVFNQKEIYLIDGVQTLIYSVKGNLAKGAILNSDLTLSDCFIAKVGDYFAHGETAHKAFEDANRKALQNMPIEKQIERFMDEFGDVNKKYPAKKFFVWHSALTGSCELGRKNFCENRGIDVEKDEFTVKEFISLVENEYGKENIKKLKNELK